MKISKKYVKNLIVEIIFLFNKTHNQFLQTYCQHMNIWKESLDRMKPTLRSCMHSLTTSKHINYKQHITTPKSTEPHKVHQQNPFT